MSDALNTAAAARGRPADQGLRASRPALPWAVPLASGLLAAAVFSWALLERAAALKLSAYDTAFFEQLVWNAGRGRGFTSGFFAAEGITSPANFLGLHFSPLLALPAALELAWPDARVLSLLSAAALGLAAPAAYLHFRALLEDRPGAAAASAALAAALPFWLAVQEAAQAGFHTEVLALPLVLAAAWAGLRRRTLVCWTCALAALCAREDQAYAVAVVGLLLALHGPSRRQGVALAGVAALWAGVVELVVMPPLRGAAPNDVGDYYAWLHRTGPGAVAAALANGQGWLELGAMVLAMAGLPLLRPGWLALALPPFVGSLLSSHQPQPILHLQYGLPMVLPVLVAGGLGARTLLDRAPAWVRARPAALAALALPAVVIGLAFSPLALGNPTDGTTAARRLAACTAALPAEAPVAADDGPAAALAARPAERPLTWTRSTDWVVVDRSTYVPGYVNQRARTAWLASLAADGRHRSCDDGRFQVWGPAGRG
jgi:Predicted membrane protein (DUF2079)